MWRKSSFDPVVAHEGRLKGAVSRVEIAGQAGKITVSTRVDAAAIADKDATTDSKDARVERGLLSFDLGHTVVRAGDDYVAFGHGVSLSLRKVDPLGLDTTLRGGRVDTVWGKLRATAIAGVANPQNLDPIELGIVGQSNDWIAGGEISFPVRTIGRVAPYVVFSRANGAAPDGRDIRWTLAGASTSLEFSSIRVAAELAAGKRNGMAALANENAWAAYTSTQWDVSDTLIALIETKAYRHWEIGRGDRSLLYHEPPTLERDDQEVPANDNAIGARARIEWRMRRDTTLFANALGYRYSQDETDPRHGDSALHGFAGIDHRFSDNASTSLQLGFRDENRADGRDKLSLWHIDADGAMPLGNRFALTLKWNHRQEKKALFRQVRFRRGLAVLGLSLSGIGTLSALYGYSTEEATTPTHYPAGELLIHLPRGGSLRLFVGRLTEGRVCVSGSCRDVPPFEGARLDLFVQL